MTSTGLSTSQLLQVWEEARDRHPLDRALLVLRAGHPDASWDDLCRLPIGHRDAALLALRSRTFGDRIKLLATCPTCGARAELTVDVRALLLQPPTDAAAPLVLEDGELRIHCRLPDSRDLAAVLGLDPARALEELRARCVVGVERAGQPIDAEITSIDEAVGARLDARLAAADPQADLELGLDCPSCAGRWSELLDIGEAFFVEIDVEARRILGEVHALARAYAWREADILAMSPERRASYLELVGA